MERRRRRQKWRFELKTGDVVDAMDSDLRWFDAKIVNCDADRVKVHYRGWSSKWDSWLKRLESKSLQKIFTHTEDWRRLQKDDAVEVRSDDTSRALWLERQRHI